MRLKTRHENMFPPRPIKKKQSDETLKSIKTKNESRPSFPEFNRHHGTSITSETGSRRSWRQYFDRQLEFEIQTTPDEKDVFTAHMAGSIHHNVVLCLHGGGHTSLSWCLVAGLLKHAFCVISYDCRGHGLTRCQRPYQLDNAQLVSDGLNIITKIRELIASERKSAEERGEVQSHEPEEMTIRDKILMRSRTDGVPIILMGHSLGGAIAIQLAATKSVPNLQGLIVLDVVEGAAIEALPTMKRFVEHFPPSFKTEDGAIEWALKHVLRNRESAELSIPSQLYFDDKEKLWKWRVDLGSTSDYWEGWFRGISQQFLTAHVGSGGKVLVLVGHDRLDKDLTIGHMQGKYQLQIIAKSGHVIEEDQPNDVAEIVLQFASRYRLLANGETLHYDSDSTIATSAFPTGPMFPLESEGFKKRTEFSSDEL